ncbi:MAG: hypothetical protein ACKOKF_07230, partial [Bacteroidota bacterium]
PVTVTAFATGYESPGIPCSPLIGTTRNMTIPFDATCASSFQWNGSNVMQVIFNNTSPYLGVATAYNWTWYDVTTATTLSNLPFPGPITLTPGPHTIQLSIFDPITLATCTISKNIVVPAPIVANFSVSAPVCQNSTALFTDLSVNIANVASRLFNNGNSATSNAPTANLLYTGAGPTYTATLAVTDIYGCASTASQVVSVISALPGSITVGSASCDSVQLTASGPGPFTWTVISPPPVPNNPVYVKTSGFYKVTGIGINGCPYTAGPVFVTVNPSPVVTLSGPTQYCQGEALGIKTSTAGVNFSWIRLPSTPVGTNSPNLNIIANTPGTFTYQVTVTAANGCTGIGTYTITVDPVPAAASIIASGPLTFCQGDSVQLTVSPVPASVLWSKSPAPPLSAPANAQLALWATQSGTYTAIAQTANGCAYPAIAPLTITVNPVPPANITGDTVVCRGETLTLTSTPDGGSTYLWSGPAATGNTNPFVKTNMQLTDAGSYSVIVTNTFGCSSRDTVTVLVKPTPPAPFIVSNPGGTLCQGNMYNLSVLGPLGPPITYNWSTGQIGTSINAVLPGNYSVTAVNLFGCTAQSNTLTIYPRPDLSCAPEGCYEFCNECDSVTIPGVSGLASSTWEILTGGVFVFYSNSQNLTVLPPGGKFRLIGANQWGCTDSTDTLFIDFSDCCPSVDTTLCVDACIDFDNNNLNGFQPYVGAPNVVASATNLVSQNGPSDYYVIASDLPGPSLLEGNTSLLGKWCCGEFCFDYKFIDDAVAGSPNVNPSFTIMNGTLGFTFTAAAAVNENSPWQRFCAPISDCNLPPTGPSGTWLPLAGTNNIDWPTVLSNVTNVLFTVDYSASILPERSGYDNICITPGLPNVSAGNDTIVCAGSVVTLHADSCNGNATWYQLSENGLAFVGNGPVIDVTPQQSTCYVLICCNAGTCCCDTDTVCVNVKPLPVLNWPTVYPSICNNGGPVTLNPADITIVPVSMAGGTGFFSGVGVSGNVFTPPGIGSYTICYNYTAPNGCSAVICNTINVQFCCDTTLHVDAGPDTTICKGGVAILTATGCTGNVTWYKMAAMGLVPVGQGSIFDAVPQQSTCYVVICCDPYYPACCDTDTVCVNVKPLPALSWPTVYPNVCNNGGPVTLNPADILVLVNNVPTPVTQAGGSGFFSGV